MLFVMKVEMLTSPFKFTGILTFTCRNTLCFVSSTAFYTESVLLTARSSINASKASLFNFLRISNSHILSEKLKLSRMYQQRCRRKIRSKAIKFAPFQLHPASGPLLIHFKPFSRREIGA